MTRARTTFLLTFFGLALFSASPAIPQATYEVIDVSNGGIITGHVKWSGARIKPPAVPITKDAAVCDPQGQKIRDMERLAVGPDGGVADTLVYLKDITAGKAMDLPVELRAIDQRTCRYVPHIALVPRGQEVMAKSSDPILHTMQMSGAASYNLPFPFQNQFLKRTLNAPGVIDLRCNAGHVWMNGVIVVVRHPYVAVTDEHGAFRLTGVPPGKYQIVAWHEGWKITRETQTLDVGTQQMTKRLHFDLPVTIEKSVAVDPGASSTVEFVLSAK
jgi:hypothetical protein